MTDASARTALVTGGAQGIGKGLCHRFLEAGWHVIAADVDEDAGRQALAELGAAGRLHFIHCDVAEETQVAACVAETVARTGGLTALVNNAGIASPELGPPEALALACWNRMLAVNLTGPFLMAKHAIPHLRARRGAIVNIASTRALQSEPHTEAYAATKGGVVALTHALAMSLGPEVRVNCVSPGWIDVTAWQKAPPYSPATLRPADHAQHPVGRVGTPADIAALVLFLVSDAAGFVTGQNFVVDGGMTRKMIYLP
jgi:NAD(P)-dependent dehydrogenase (short-subunit alcohol dehydrogenase family)